MEIIKKICLALLISIGVVAVAVVLIAPFALIENTYIKMGICFLLIFGFVLALICCGDDNCDCDDNCDLNEPRMSVKIEEEINEFAHDYAKKNFGGDSYEAYAEQEDIANACIAAANWAFGKAPKWVEVKKGDEFKEKVMFATAKDLEDGLVSNMLYSEGCTAPEDGYCISFEDVINLPIE